jgi:hypothetical protein
MRVELDYSGEPRETEGESRAEPVSNKASGKGALKLLHCLTLDLSNPVSRDPDNLSNLALRHRVAPVQAVSQSKDGVCFLVEIGKER